VFNVFDPSTRAGLKSLWANAAPTLARARPAIRQALTNSAPALGQVDAVFRDLGGNEAALGTLVDSTDAVVNAVGRSNPGVRRLLQGAADTFSAAASQSHALQTAISEAPQALQNADQGLVHLSGTLDRTATLADRLSPGVTQLRQLAAPLASALRTVVGIAPAATDTLDTVRAAGPSLDSLLTRARTPLMPRLRSIGKQAAKELNCVRPYTPEIVGFFSTWGGFWANGDRKDKILYGALGLDTVSDENVQNSAQVGAIDPMLKIDFPQVPGAALNQPWYQPQCGMTANNMKLAADPEANTYDPKGSKLLPYPSR
jgi:phospholipid/cholesterol/gamma-HCH transport system substrate-binding protein